jgi:hypothetical protein
MYGPLKGQKQWAGRDQVRGTTSYSTGLNVISVFELQRTSIINRHFETIFREQQREASPLREGAEASGLEQQRDYSQSQAGVAREGLVIRDEERSEAEQGKLVRTDMAIVRLAARDGYIQIGIPKGCLSENQYQTSRKWSKGAHDSFRKWSRSMTHYFRKWSYQVIFKVFPTPFYEHYLDLAIYCANSEVI